MTLRLRLVLALMVLVLAGLGLFGVATYSLYARSQYSRLDDQIRASVPFVTRQLTAATPTGGDGGGGGGGKPDAGGGPGGAGPGGDGRSGDGGPPPLVPVATYSELRNSSGEVVTTVQLAASTAKPSLPEHVRASTPSAARFFTAGSDQGSGHWRVYASPATTGTTVV
ncbi:MAG: two-component system, OmpR family, sensor kinase, partial [Acidimicrobiaceae bacterium]|nr:two-component system, OmpR family, sensor kinase [Acidimicrobiaceae bacterium]